MIFTCNALLMPAFSLPLSPRLLSVTLHRCPERSPTLLTSYALPLILPLIQPARRLIGRWERKEKGKVRSHGFGTRLDPRWIVGAKTHSTSELLRTL